MDEIRAALCEDDRIVRDLLARSLSAEFDKFGAPVRVETYATGDDLLAALVAGARYEVFFLDIEMPGTDGIELCRRIRKGIAAEGGAAAVPPDPEALVVFVSNKEELVFQSIEVRPFRFMRKSHFVDEQEATVRAIVSELGRRQGHVVTVSDAGTGLTYRVDTNEVTYVEVIGKRCHIHTQRGTIDVRSRLSDIEALLDERLFLKPHRSYLVNARHVQSVGRESVALDDGTSVPLSRNRAHEVREQFMALVREGL